MESCQLWQSFRRHVGSWHSCSALAASAIAPFLENLLKMGCLPADITTAATREPTRDHHPGKLGGCLE